jgi:hypothetical protein
MHRGISGVCALALFGMAAAWAQSQAAPPTEEPASVAGVIANSLTGEPLLRAHIQLQLVGAGGPGNQSYGAMTNSEGKFSITKMPPGHYMITMDRIGFVVPLNAAGNRTSDITLGAGDKKDTLKLTLTPVGAITGRVLDADGEPVQNANVAAEGSTGSGGTNSTTDDKGEYRIGGLRPGRYRIKASPQALPLPPEIRSDGTTDAHYSPTYYPGVLPVTSATRLQVQPAAQLAGMDIRLVRTPMVTVSGKVTGAPEGAKNIMIQVQRLSASGFSGSSGSQAKPDGTFYLWRLDPGKYTLTASIFSPGGMRMQSAPLDIEVTTTNIEHLELRMVPPFDLTGEMRFEDEQARRPQQPPARPGQTQGQGQNGAQPAPPPAQPRRIMLRQVSGNFGQMSQADVGADDTLQFEKLQPGLYHLTLSWPAYVKSVRVGSTETEGDVLDLRNGPAGAITIVASSATGQISGTAADSKGPMAGAMVALVPEPDRRQYFRTATAGQDGTYSMTNIPPGKYRLLVADDDFNMGTARTGNGLEDYADILVSVEIHPGDNLTKDLKARATAK